MRANNRKLLDGPLIDHITYGPQRERAAGLVANYLTALWQLPCYDCWEEYPDKMHPHTLAAIYGGLKAHS